MAPMNNSVETPDVESPNMSGPRYSDMRRVSMSLAFSPARHQRRRKMRSANNWFRTRLGIGRRRSSR